MSLLAAELRLTLRSGLAAGALALLLALSTLSVWSGLQNVARQNATIERVLEAHAGDFEKTAATYGKPDGEAGDAAYYTFLATWDRPSALAFAALGQRDVQPYVLRIRALGLQSQLYESENLNAELALPGAFDFAFVLIYLAPLVVIALTHDLLSGEREAGRLRLLLSMPSADGALWRRRTAVRYGLVLAALLAPLVVALCATGAPFLLSLGMVAASVVYLAFWFGVGLAVAAWAPASATSAAALVGCWILLTLVAPTVVNAALTRAIPVAKGVDLTLAQRELVHRAWDIPKDATLRPFFVNHPEWKDTPPVAGRFHWKWYYAMHQVGDEGVADQVAAYRNSLTARQIWTERAGWLLPPVAAQHVLHRLADTDLSAHVSYQDSIAELHSRLRRFYYPYLFLERPFTRADFDRLPQYAPREPTATWPAGASLALTLAAAAALALGAALLGWRLKPGRPDVATPGERWAPAPSGGFGG